MEPAQYDFLHENAKLAICGLLVQLQILLVDLYLLSDMQRLIDVLNKPDFLIVPITKNHMD